MCHPPYGRKSVGLDQVLLALEQVVPHGIECARELSGFITAFGFYWVTEVALFQSRDTSEQARKRTRERVRNKKYEHTAQHNCEDSKAEKKAAQFLQGGGRLVVRLQYRKAHVRWTAGGEV